MDEAYPFCFDPTLIGSKACTQIKVDNSFTRKLKNFFPLFDSSFSLWEISALEKSDWLQASTSMYKGSSNGGPSINSYVVPDLTLPEGSSLPIKASDQSLSLALDYPLPVPTDSPLQPCVLSPIHEVPAPISSPTLPFATE